MSTDVASAPAQPQPASLSPSLNEIHDEPELARSIGAKQTFLSSPPDSNNAVKLDQSDSELSELEDDIPDLEPPPAGTMDDDTHDIGVIEPDHYSGTVPVFKPTMEQFRDFKLFMSKIDGYGMKSGIVKIIPPQEWKESLPSYDELVKQIRVREPIKQDIMGSNGTYRQVNILHGRSYNLPQWRQLCDQSEHQPPARRGERRANHDRPKPPPRPRPDPAKKAQATTQKKRGRGRPSKKGNKQKCDNDNATETEDRPMTPVSPKMDVVEETPSQPADGPNDEGGAKEEIVQSIEADPGLKSESEDEAPVIRRMGAVRPNKPKTQSTSARRKFSRREGSVKIDEAAFKDFDYRMDISDYTPERCEELERIYWKTLTYAPPLYGADLMGTLFGDTTELWNLNKLPNLLDVMGTKVPGVNTAYLYLGMWKATFAWHLEDVDLYSINFLHFGAPKQWYSISQADARRFEAAMKSIWPTDAKACDQFLRHKAFLISPAHLQQYFNIKVNKCLSYPGEFVVTYPYGYHSGYNLGYNCAEAVNFALDSWLPMGKIAKRCECAQAQDSVWINVYEIERKLRGEETEYEYTEDEEEEEEENDESGLPTPPASSSVKTKVSRKRKRPLEKAEKRPAKKIRLRVKIKVEPPCCLCPNNIPGADVLQTDDGRKAHRMCALYLPETYIDVVDGNEVIRNAANIDKGRLDLKCLYCRSKRGACFQCSQQKCARAYHATCAAAAGVFVEEADVPVFGEDGTEYKEQAFEFSCRFHRTKRDKKIDGEALEADKNIRSAAAALKAGEICQLQYFRGDIFAGVVVENRPDEETLLLDIIPNGDRVEVEWKWLLLPHPSDFHLPKASSKALPLPTSRKAKDELNAKRAEDDTPRKDMAFVDGYTWAEYEAYEPDNKGQAKVDLAKENQVWYYLGKTSTDSRPQYTDNPAKPQHNPKSNFLDTIPKPPKPPKPPKSTSTPRRPSSGVANPSPSTQAPVNPAGTTRPEKPEKPYVYKPRKPVEPTFTVSNLTPQRPMPSPASNSVPASAPYQYGTDPRFQSTGYSAQRFEPKQGPGYSPGGVVTSLTPSPTVRGQSVWSEYPAQTLQGVQQNVTAATCQIQPLHTQGLQVGITSVFQKLPFYQTHYNREPSSYRTPYSHLGGFTNGYEGSLRAHLMKSPEALFSSHRNMGFGANSSLLSHSPLPFQTTQNQPGGSHSQNSAYSSNSSPVPSLSSAASTQTQGSPHAGQYKSPGHTGAGLFTGGYAAGLNYHLYAGFNPSPYRPPAKPPKPSKASRPAIPALSPKSQTPKPSPSALNVSHEKSPGPLPVKTKYKAPSKESPVPLPAKYLAVVAASTGKATSSPPISPTTDAPATDPQPIANSSTVATTTATDSADAGTSVASPSPGPLRISTTPIPLPPIRKPSIVRPATLSPLSQEPAAKEAAEQLPAQPPEAIQGAADRPPNPQTNQAELPSPQRDPQKAHSSIEPPHTKDGPPEPHTVAQGEGPQSQEMTGSKDHPSDPPRPSIFETFELPEVPQDSTGFLENLLTNLRRASGTNLD